MNDYIEKTQEEPRSNLGMEMDEDIINSEEEPQSETKMEMVEKKLKIQDIFETIDKKYKTLNRLNKLSKSIFEYEDIDVYYIGCSGQIIEKQAKQLLTRNIWNGWNTKIPFYGSDNKVKNILIKIKDFIINNLLLIFVIISIVLIIIYIIKKKHQLSIKSNK